MKLVCPSRASLLRLKACASLALELDLVAADGAGVNPQTLGERCARRQPELCEHGASHPLPKAIIFRAGVDRTGGIEEEDLAILSYDGEVRAEDLGPFWDERESGSESLRLGIHCINYYAFSTRKSSPFLDFSPYVRSPEALIP